jgi:hypothetical protein
MLWEEKISCSMTLFKGAEASSIMYSLVETILPSFYYSKILSIVVTGIFIDRLQKEPHGDEKETMGFCKKLAEKVKEFV